MRLFTEREWRLIAFGTAAATLIAVIIAMGVSLSRNRNRNVAPDFAAVTEYSLDVTDLQVPDEYRIISLSRSYVFRPRLQRWTPEQIERFWIDPRFLQLEELRAETDELIRSYFANVR